MTILQIFNFCNFQHKIRAVTCTENQTLDCMSDLVSWFPLQQSREQPAVLGPITWALTTNPLFASHGTFRHLLNLS